MDILSLSQVFFIFFLGMRHGLDPDHVAIIDGIALRLLKSNKIIAPFTGTFFALGHGFVIIFISTLFALLNISSNIFESIPFITEYIPILILFIIGTVNFVELLKNKNDFSPISLKSNFLPSKIRNGENILSIFLTGVFFALVFDTATQAAAWGYSASNKYGVIGALFIGFIFTIGMMISDTIDSFILCYFFKQTNKEEYVNKYRRGIGWFTVISSYLIVMYFLISNFIKKIQISEITYSLIGFLMLLIPVLFLLSLRKLNINSKF